eukprot:254365-Prymnesium_polylepis.1
MGMGKCAAPRATRTRRVPQPHDAPHTPPARPERHHTRSRSLTSTRAPCARFAPRTQDGRHHRARTRQPRSR